MIGVAVIGAGRWGPNLLRNFHDNPRSRILWVIDSDPGRLQEVRDRFPDAQTSAEVDDAIDDRNVTALVVATPTRTHFGLARAGLENGKHVLVEKPITDSAASARELCDLADERQRVLMAGHVFVHNPAVRAIREFLDQGLVGKVCYVSMARTNLGGFRPDVNAAWDLASHDLSIANFWLRSSPVAVSAVGGSYVNPGTPDTVFATFRYPGDVLVNIVVSWLNPRKVRHATLVGDHQMLTFDDMDLNEPIRIYDKRVTDTLTEVPWVDTYAAFRSSVLEGEVRIPRVRLGEPLRVECEDFLDAIEFGRPPRTPGRDGLAVVRALEALDRSIANNGREAEVET